MKHSLLVFFGLSFAFAILFTSILRTASVRREFKQTPNGNGYTTNEIAEIEYFLAKPGDILPGHFFWPAKALRDRVWLIITTDVQRKADLRLLFADKRIGAAKILFENGDYELGISTLIKAEKYLEEALNEHISFMQAEDKEVVYARLALASLKHIEIIEQIMVMSPEDALPELVEIKDTPTKVYKRAAIRLQEVNAPVPDNPFGKE